MTARLYIAYHKPAPLVASGSLVPIHVGRAGADMGLPGMIGDDTGETISERNQSYCELTALYWAWKNAPADASHIGLMHYRRLLDLTDAHPGVMVEVEPDHLHIPDWTAAVEGWLAGPGASVDLVVPRLHLMGQSVAQNYARGHRSEDFDRARTIIMRDHAEMTASFDSVSAGRELRLGNLMLMRRGLFDRYCAWLFPILDEVAAQAPETPTSPYQSRFIGFLAERLLTVFVHHQMRSDQTLRKKEVSILNLGRTLVTPYIDDDSLNGPEHVNIAFAADRTYLPHAAAMVRSVLTRADHGRQLNLFFLHGSIADTDRALLREVVTEAHRNARLHEIDTGRAFEQAHRSASRAPSNATYSRFLLFSLLPKLRRVLYLDCDVIARTDVTALFDADLGGAEIGGVPDWIMTRTLTGPTPTMEPEIPDLGTYQRDVLGLTENQIRDYLNAGVMVFDFAAMENPQETGAALAKLAETCRYFFRDQDILNSHFKGRTAVLDARWNVFNSGVEAYGRVPRPGHGIAMSAKRDPWVIHYADAAWKPWHGTAVPLSQHYWEALIQTPFYGEVIAQLKLAADRSLGRRTLVGIARRGQRLANAVPVLRGPLLRLHAALGHPGRK